MSTLVNEKRKRRNKQFKIGIALVLGSVAFIPGIVVKALYLLLQNFPGGKGGDGIVAFYQNYDLVKFFFKISPDISLDHNFADFVAIALCAAFLFGILSIKGAYDDDDQIGTLKEQTRNEKMKEELKEEV